MQSSSIRLVVAAVFSMCMSAAFAQSVIVRDAAGTTVGIFVGNAGPSFDNLAQTGLPAFQVVSSTGYVAHLAVTSGKIVQVNRDLFGLGDGSNIGQIVYTTPDCSLQPYFALNASSASPIGGFVAVVSSPQYEVWYADRAEVGVTRQFQSTRNFQGTCQPQNFQGLSIPALPNDPAVTGFSNTPYVGPLRLTVIERPPFEFRDGFEAPPSAA